MSKRYPPEAREKAVRLALERLDEYGSAYAAARAIGPLVDVHHETLRLWIKKALDESPRPSAPTSPGLSSAEREELARLRKENRDLEQTTEILKLASAFRAGTRPATPLIVGFIDEYQQVYGVESICRALSAHGVQIAPRTYRKARHRPASARDLADAVVENTLRGLGEKPEQPLRAPEDDALTAASGPRCCVLHYRPDHGRTGHERGCQRPPASDHDPGQRRDTRR